MGSITYKEYNEEKRLPEQARDEMLIMKNKHYCLCYEPGKGKSYPAIHCMLEINKMKHGEAKVLIMSDATCIKDMWKAEIMPQKILPKNTYFVTDRTAIGRVKEALMQTQWDLIIVDECQSLRSGITRKKSQYSKLVYALTKKTEYVIGMTGTISGNNTIEPFCVLHNLNVAQMGTINCHFFRENYCVKELQYGPYGAFEKPTRLNPRGEELMKQAFAKGCSFWDYDENDEMPPLRTEFVKLQVPITKTYLDALDGIIQCNEHESTVIKAVAMQKAQQALNGFIYYNDDQMVRQTYEVEEFENPKLKWLLKECQDHNCIVAYRFQEDEVHIKKILTDNNIKITDDISEFKRRVENEHIILVIQCSRGKSANLQACQHIIYFSSDFSFISYKQMIHRTWRRGQAEGCRLSFLCNEPVINDKGEIVKDKAQVEEKIWRSLQTKQTIHDALMSIKQEV